MNIYKCEKCGWYKASEAKCSECEKVQRETWVAHLNVAKTKPGFDVKDFAGRVTFERLAVAKKAINAIGTPLLSGELPNTEKAQEYIADQLQAAVDRLLEELAQGKKNAVKEMGVVPF